VRVIYDSRRAWSASRAASVSAGPCRRYDAFIRIWRGAASFDPRRGSARGWLYAVVRNRALSIHRDEHRYETSDENVGDVDCEATLSRMPETSALRRCLEQIDRPRRDVVVLAYVHGMSRMAGRLKVPLGTVKSGYAQPLCVAGVHG
jgi:RNA polymerase sigma-70 factor (ECF subfamily)